MDIWKIERWKNFYQNRPRRVGVRLYSEKDVDPEVRRAIMECLSWLRSKYTFPKRVRIYLKADRRIRAQKGDLVCGTFFRPADRDVEPYIRLATGDYVELLQKRGKDNALADILLSLMHELTHYFQWLNDLDLTLIGEERQATIYASRLLDDYAETRDHP